MHLFFYILRSIIKNNIVRVIFLIFVFFIIFTGVYQFRFYIFNWASNIIEGPQFDNIATWDQELYGFTENPVKAKSHFKNGLQELVHKSFKAYNKDVPNKFFLIVNKPNVSWQNYISPEALEVVLSFLHEVQGSCGNAIKTSSFHDDWVEEELEHITIEQKEYQHEKYIVTSPEIAQKYYSWLLNLDSEYFVSSLQKKPDYWPSLTIRNAILEATCKPLVVDQTWHKALEYVEYKTEAFVFTNLISKHTELTPLDHILATEDALKKDLLYHKILKVFYSRALLVSKSSQWRMLSLAKAYDISKDIDILNSYIKAAVEQCQVTSIEKCTAIYKNLISIKNEDILLTPSYIYALAETSFRARLYSKSYEHLYFGIQQNIFKDPIDIKNIERLLILNHLVHGVSLLDVTNPIQKNTNK